ncbi:MAG: hypothetical protein A2V51_04870 [Candidatus Dadabacteria bacterium RBG_19FT_COMBO_40_33]|nr:MAG: hypothetical protein A2V51_04870 [Candidatus Dadabacteria bacterium RBG_19FT_COMBO_40_33]
MRTGINIWTDEGINPYSMRGWKTSPSIEGFLSAEICLRIRWQPIVETHCNASLPIAYTVWKMMLVGAG